MLLEIIRLVFGSVRFFLTGFCMLLGGLVVWHDVWGGSDVSSQAYMFLGGMLAQVIVYQLSEGAKRSDPQVLSKIAAFLKKAVKK